MALGRIWHAKDAAKQAVKKAFTDIADITVEFINANGIKTRDETGSVVLMNKGGWARKVFTFDEYTPDGQYKDSKIRLSLYQKQKDTGEYKRRDNCTLNAGQLVEFAAQGYGWLDDEHRAQFRALIEQIHEAEEKNAA
jgi:hypothetical protein